ncbi:putative Tripeptidyl aminopeptidase [Streptomyces aurantiacus JA 4570]|uniref:Putative Tripeptidyl aminopeptidase n=1 Tax=Streptomyces aurantiacus JA 4570 TaxID=1286094 RepID=S3Z928_9ACTN|nr:putative Tripeptidyl aminopeptidase [Streptomyces aurantiacus JA 4570]
MTALTVTTSMALVTPAATAAPPESALARYYDQRLAWRSCVFGPDDEGGKYLEKAGARCANVTVPLDYADPGGRTIKVAISRIKATDTRHRVGPMLLNYGGPGDPTLYLPPVIRDAMKGVAARYDLIGMDPRFVGRSTGMDCEWPVSTYVLSAGLGRASFERQVGLHKRLADACRDTHGDVLPHVSTRNAARDMDVIRGSLGAPKLSYLGYSYGTYLGTVYTQMFPGRYDRMVLDSALDPARYQPQLMRGAEPENERALADWATWAAKRHGKYQLGRTRAQVLATIDRVVAKSARGLTLGTAPDTYRIDDTHVPLLLLSGNADDTDAGRKDLADTVSVLARAAMGKPTRLTESLTATLRVALTGAESAYGSTQTAILCGDVAAPRDPEHYWRDIERSRAAHPVFGPLANNINPCAFWDRPREQPTQVSDDARALIVAATGDPRTPYPVQGKRRPTAAASRHPAAHRQGRQPARALRRVRQRLRGRQGQRLSGHGKAPGQERDLRCPVALRGSAGFEGRSGHITAM